MSLVDTSRVGLRMKFKMLKTEGIDKKMMSVKKIMKNMEGIQQRVA